MSRLEQIGNVFLSEAEVEPVVPTNGITFKFRHEGASELYEIALTGCELDRVVLSGLARGLNLGGCNQYDYEIRFPEPSNNLFVVCRAVENCYIQNDELARDFDAHFKIGAKSIGFYQIGWLSATRTVNDGWQNRKYRATSILSPAEPLSEELTSNSLFSFKLSA